MKKCPECSAEIDEQAVVCHECGCPAVIKNTAKPNKKKSKLMIAAGIIFIIIGVCIITSSTYKLFCDEKDKCITNRDIAYSQTGEYFFVETYNKMIDTYNKTITKFRILTIAFCVSGSVILVLGIKNMKKE